LPTEVADMTIIASLDWIKALMQDSLQASLMIGFDVTALW